MGHKTHPVGFRLGVIKDWQSRWFAGNRKDYSANVIEDWRIRDVIKTRYAEAGISKIEIERSAQDVTVNVHTARPGIVIGRGGQRVDELRKAVEGASGVNRVRLNVLEIRQPELDALLVARNVAEQLERR
ncbi:MAG: 30S ribosomal protein S3, partial [Dehalococcoidia bacterium]|nr:30S ribosomal protein S3 [Dehalococcoidia bacterium]